MVVLDKIQAHSTYSHGFVRYVASLFAEVEIRKFHKKSKVLLDAISHRVGSAASASESALDRRIKVK